MRGKVTIGAGKHYVNSQCHLSHGLSRPSTSLSSTSPLPGPTSTYLLRIWWLRNDPPVSCARKSGRVMVMVGALGPVTAEHTWEPMLVRERAQIRGPYVRIS